VVRAVRFARDAGLPVVIRGGGHHAAGFSLVDGGVVIDVGGMKGVVFDPAALTALVDAGAGWRGVDRVGTARRFATPGTAWAAAAAC
jgi:FAD/FMN-containing dehydrogenase